MTVLDSLFPTNPPTRMNVFIVSPDCAEHHQNIPYPHTFYNHTRYWTKQLFQTVHSSIHSQQLNFAFLHSADTVFLIHRTKAQQTINYFKISTSFVYQVACWAKSSDWKVHLICEFKSISCTWCLWVISSSIRRSNMFTVGLLRLTWSASSSQARSWSLRVFSKPSVHQWESHSICEFESSRAPKVYESSANTHYQHRLLFSYLHWCTYLQRSKQQRRCEVPGGVTTYNYYQGENHSIYHQPRGTSSIPNPALHRRDVTRASAKPRH